MHFPALSSPAEITKVSKAPKKPLTAYNLYFRDERAKVLKLLQANARRPEHKELTRYVAKKWKLISPQEKAYYTRLAMAEKQKYARQLVQWHDQQQQYFSEKGSLTTEQGHQQWERVQKPSNSDLPAPTLFDEKMVLTTSLNHTKNYYQAEEAKFSRPPLELPLLSSQDYNAQDLEPIPHEERVVPAPRGSLEWLANELGRDEICLLQSVMVIWTILKCIDGGIKVTCLCNSFDLPSPQTVKKETPSDPTKSLARCGVSGGYTLP